MFNIDHDLTIIEVRLGEAWEAFAVEKAIHETANKDADPELAAKLNKHGAAWNAILHALQTMVILGMYVVLDQDGKSATLFSVLREVKKVKPHAAFTAIEEKLNALRLRYKKYRNELYAHNSRSRSDTIDEFNLEGFTWSGMERDLRYLSYAWKVLWAANRRQSIPDEAEASRLNDGHDDGVRAAADHTAALLAVLKNASY
jgi:hypothetical protein